ncbi:MAG: hypothetical protein FWF10_02775 [Clostridiales bacterium]|nr:hypothetical protein [Clostridiales bacterium]
MFGIIISVIGGVGGIVSIISVFLTMIEKVKARKSAAEAAEHAKNADAANRTIKEYYDKMLAHVSKAETYEDRKAKVRTYLLETKQKHNEKNPLRGIPGFSGDVHITLGQIESALPDITESVLRKIISELLSEGIIREFIANGIRDTYVVN